MLRKLFRRLFTLLLCCLIVSALLVLALRWINPPGTALMVERKIESWRNGQPIDLQREWRPWQQLPDSLKISVIAGEDQKFPDHWGFDVDAIRQAIIHNAEGGDLRGASTISQQVAKNLFLWSERSWPRKALEVWFTGLIELFWPKQRILEVYLNSVEWGNGIFGAEAAARAHFGIGAPYLSNQQASLLAAILPNPRAWNPARPSAYVSNRAAWIRQQSLQLGGSRYLEQLAWQRPQWWPHF